MPYARLDLDQIKQPPPLSPSSSTPAFKPMEGGEAMEVYEPLSAEEVESFAARLDLHPDNLRHIIIEPMKSVDDFDLRAELEEWVKEHQEEKERTKGMTLDQLTADTMTRFVPVVAAAFRRAQEYVAALDKEEEDARTHKAKAGL
ncbi:hypothetical protein ACP4OV_019637 [Aristida adscensionis]